MDSGAPALVSLGEDTGAGNLLGLQPWVTPGDYASARRFYARLAGYFADARRRGLLGPRTVAVLPEYIGTWLVAAGAPAPALHTQKVSRAMPLLLASHAPAFLAALLRSRSRDRLREALFRTCAPAMARIYHTVCARLAAEHGVTLVAGSIVLPSARVAGGELRAGPGPLQNICAVYRADGAPEPRLTRKLFPIDAEAGFTAPGATDDLPVFDTPAGRLGVAICADSWQPHVYDALRGAGAELLAVPSYLAPAGVWEAPWGGYNGAAAPPDVDLADVGRLSEGQAWLKYALAGRAAKAGFRAGVNVFLRGRLWDLGADGLTTGVRGAARVCAPAADAPALVNVWL